MCPIRANKFVSEFLYTMVFFFLSFPPSLPPSLSLSLPPSLAQVGIPENAVRKSDRMMEEFHIPHSSAPPPPVGEEKVRIAEIDDDLIQIAFQGTVTPFYLYIPYIHYSGELLRDKKLLNLLSSS